MTSPSEKNDAFKSSEFQENLEILRQILFFSGIPLERLKVIAYICNRETFKQGEYIFRQDEDDGQAFYILSGKTCLIYKGEEGEEDIRDYEEGEFLGGISLLGEMRRHFSLKACGDVTCLILSRDKFTSTVQQFPELMPRIIKSMVERINDWEGRFIGSREESCKLCRHKLGVSLL